MILAELIPLLLTMLEKAPAVVAEVESIWKLASATTAPTTAEQATIDAALEASYKAVQAP